MRIVTTLIALTCLCLPVQAQEADKTKPPSGDQDIVKQDIPKDASVFDKLNMKTTDTGREVRQRLELDVLKDKDTFVFGSRTTTYPTARNPGQEFQPVLPQTQPKDTYSIGIGKRF